MTEKEQLKAMLIRSGVGCGDIGTISTGQKTKLPCTGLLLKPNDFVPSDHMPEGFDFTGSVIFIFDHEDQLVMVTQIGPEK